MNNTDYFKSGIISDRALEKQSLFPRLSRQRKKKMEKEENNIRVCSLVATNMVTLTSMLVDIQIFDACTTYFYDSRQPFCGSWIVPSAQRIFPILPFADSQVLTSRFITV